MPSRCWTLAAALVVGAFGHAAAAPPQTYTWLVEHPTYGRIGTYSDTIERSGDERRVTSRLAIAVKVLGIVVHREEASRVEVWRGGRLVSFQGTTSTNGTPITVAGEARPNGFAITSPSGDAMAPSNIYTSDPFSALLPNPKVEMSTKTGRVFPVKLAKRTPEVITIDGTQIPVEHYEIVVDKRQDVWADRNGVPVRFRTVEDGTPIDFVLAPEKLTALGYR